MIETKQVYAFHFKDMNQKEAKYWRDVGTLDAYFEANMDLVSIDPQFNLYDKEWPIRTYVRSYPPAKTIWDLDYEGASKVPHAPLWGGSTSGPRALPGNYQVKLTVLGTSYTAPLEIRPDPRLAVTQGDLEKQFALLIKIRDKVTETDDAINQIRDLREQMNAINKRLKSDLRGKSIADAGKSVDKKMTEVEEALIQTKAKSGQDVLNFPVRLNNHLVALGGVVSSADTAPTKQSYEVFDMLSKAVDEQLARWKAIVATDVKSYDDLVKQQEIPALIVKQATETR